MRLTAGLAEYGGGLGACLAMVQPLELGTRRMDRVTGMKKSHGPAFRKTLRPLRECLDCRGAGVVSGVFHQMDCAACNASGWVCAETGAALPLDELVLQLNFKLRALMRDFAIAKQPANTGGPQQQYEQNNRRGAGGSNYTGD